MHLGADHDFTRALKNVRVSPRCAHTSSVTLLKGLAKASTQPHAHSQLEACCMDGAFQQSQGKIFWEEHQSYSGHWEAAEKLQKYSNYTVALIIIFYINLLKVKRN